MADDGYDEDLNDAILLLAARPDNESKRFTLAMLIS